MYVMECNVNAMQCNAMQCNVCMCMYIYIYVMHIYILCNIYMLIMTRPESISK